MKSTPAKQIDRIDRRSAGHRPLTAASIESAATSRDISFDGRSRTPAGNREDAGLLETQKNEDLSQLTRDQSFVASLVASGALTQEEAERSPYRAVILQAIGRARKVDVALDAIELEAGDILLLCTDGLSDKVKAQEMAEALRTHSLREPWMGSSRSPTTAEATTTSRRLGRGSRNDPLSLADRRSRRSESSGEQVALAVPGSPVPSPAKREGTGHSFQTDCLEADSISGLHAKRPESWRYWEPEPRTSLCPSVGYDQWHNGALLPKGKSESDPKPHRRRFPCRALPVGGEK